MFLQGYLPSILEGTVLTLQVAVASLAVSVVLGLIGAMFKMAPSKPLVWLAELYSTVVRGVPDLVWMLLLFFGGQMLIKAASSNPTARLFAYRPDGSLIGEVQNGGGSRYGGTVMPYQPYDPGTVTIKSSAGGSTTVPTTPFQI